MRRVHLFEFEDQSWFPGVFREGITDYLQYASNRVNLYKPILPFIEKGLNLSKSNMIIDICSGGGGGILKIYEQLKLDMFNSRVILTDKYPNLDAFRETAEASGGNIDFVEKPVDAVDVPKELKGFRTQFVSFHHFKPDQARRILQNAAESGMPIGIFEATERSFMNFIAMLFTPIVVMLAVPFIKPFKWSRIIFTYLIPAIPFFTMWDGLVSVLRTYSIEEMKEMTSSIDVPGYRWEIGKVKNKKGPALLYLLGYPVKE